MIQYRRKKTSPEVQGNIVTDYIAGMPIKDIMERYKVSKDTIYRILRKQV